MDELENKNEMKTLVSCTNMLLKKGFKTQFQATDEGLKSLSTKYVFQPEEVEIVNYYRFEGESNPADNAILYAIQTASGEKGTLTNAYGVYSDKAVDDFVQSVDALQKKVNKDKSL